NFPASSASGFVPPKTAEELVGISNAKARYTFTSYGGGLKLVELLDYPETISRVGGRPSGPKKLATLNTLVPLPILVLLGGESLGGEQDFKLTPGSGSIRAERPLANGLY